MFAKKVNIFVRTRQKEVSAAPNPAPVLAKRLVKSRSDMPTYRTNGSLVTSPRLRRKQSSCLIAENEFRQLSVKDKARLYNNYFENMTKKTLKLINHTVTSPRQRRKQTPKSCLIAENLYRQLSVKDKAQLYDKLNDVNTKKHTKSNKQPEVIKNNVRQAVARGGVVYEKQESVKSLVKDLFEKHPLPKHTISSEVLRSISMLNLADQPSEERTKLEHTIRTTTLVPNPLEALAKKADYPAEERTEPVQTFSSTALITLYSKTLAKEAEDLGLSTIQDESTGERLKPTELISNPSEALTKKETKGEDTPAKPKLKVSFLQSPDQGFETCSTDADSPMPKQRLSIPKKLILDQPKDMLSEGNMLAQKMDMPSILTNIPKILGNTHSSFWVRADESTIMLEIFYNSPERVCSLYDRFCQKSSGSRKVCFGIDNIKFSTDKTDDRKAVSEALPKNKGSSHYWFSNGDSQLRFSGKYISADKVEQLFAFIGVSFKKTGCISFGVDNTMFSHIPEFVQENFPNTSRTSSNNNSKKSSDLEHSESDLEELSETLDQTQVTPLKNTNFSFTENGHNNSPATSSSTEEDHTYDTLNQLFEDAKQSYNLSRTQTDKLASEQTVNVSEMLETLLRQKSALKTFEQRLSSVNVSSSALVECKDSPNQLCQLRRIINIIDRIGSVNGFKTSSKQQLESFLFFLVCYTNIWLETCSVHIEKIIDALMEEPAVVPPENELQKSHDHNPAALSEHQLRVQASLQRLNIPDWYRQYNQQTSRSPDGGAAAGAYKPGNFTRKRTTESGRWAGLNSKTTSLSSLGSQRSDRSPLLLSPSAHSHHGGGGGPNAAAGAVGAHQHHQHHGGTGAYGTGGPGSFSRWSTSHLNSSQTSPSVSQRGSFSRGGPVNSSFMSVASGNSNVIRNSFRQPYLGWRSTEKLSQRTPHERLASSLLAQQQRTSPTQRTANGDGVIGGVGTKLQAVTPEIQTSIKEVTSAIVHYVNDQTQQQRSRSTSPNSRKCWLESSFVGTRPLDSPQTPVIESTTNTFSSAAASSSYNNNNNINNNNNSISSAYLNSSANSSIHSHILTQAGGAGVGFGPGGVIATGGSATANAAEVLRMNGLSCVGGAPERSLSTASLEDVLASLLGLPSTSSAGTGAGASAGDAYARSTTDGASASETLFSYRQQQHQQQQHMPQQQQQQPQQQQQLLVNPTQAEQQRLRRRSEGDAPTKQHKQQQQQQKEHNQQQQQQQQNATNATTTNPTTTTNTRRVSLGDSTESATAGATGNHASSSSSSLKQQQQQQQQPNAVAMSAVGGVAVTVAELPIKCRNTKCDRSASAADAKKHYKSCHNCTHLYCTRECRRAHWEKHRKACLHARASNLCRQVLATCKDDLDSQRHLSVLARKGYLSQGRGVVRVLFRSAESAEGFIKHGFQCMGEASYVRWPDLMPAEMGLELYSELLKLSTEYKPDSKMLIYVAICVVSEAPGMGQAPVRWERQLVSRCAKLKLCKTVLGELDQQQAQVMPLAVVAVPEPTTEILILTFNPALRPSAAQRELILNNILDILSRRGVLLRKHYPEIYQRLQSYSEGQTDKFNPVTLHPRDSHSGQGFVCIIMPVHSDSEIIKLPSAADGGNRVTTIDVGSPAALAQFDDDELLTRPNTS